MPPFWKTPAQRRHEDVIAWLRELDRELETIMATSAEIKALIAEIGDDLDEIIAKLEAATGGLTAAEAQEIADLLKPIAAKVPEPEAPPEG